MIRCPVCKADNSQGPNCRRCKADLSMLFTLETNREYRLVVAQSALDHALLDEAYRLIAEVNTIRADAHSQKLAALAALLQGQFAEALQCYRLAHRSEITT